jgi:rod shape-determining protein MreD
MKKVRRTLIGVLALVLAVMVQLVIVNRSPLPGGGMPDLVLLTVTALAVTNGPLAGLLTGFFGGLVLDIAPPGGHLAGEYALVFCLVGYGCGRLNEAFDTSGEHATVSALTVMAAGMVAGEAGKAAIGLMVSDPEVTGPAVRQVLPGAVLYDLLLSPFALWLISFVSGRRRALDRAPAVQPKFRPELLSAPQTAGVFRLASTGTGGVPRLRLADARARTRIAPPRREPKLRLANSGARTRAAPPRREPKLRLASGRSALVSRTPGGTSLTPSISAGGRPARVNFSSRGRALGNVSLFGQGSSKMAKPGKGWLRTKPVVADWKPRSPSSGWLRSGQRSKRDGWLNRGTRYGTGSAAKYRYRRGQG